MILHPIIDRLKTIADLLPTAIGGDFVPTGTKYISITENGTTTENVASYANAEIIVNVPPSGIIPTGTKQISITQNGTTTEDVTNYASAEITVNVPPSGLVKKTGTVSIESNYTYTGNVNATYTGMEIDTELSNIYSVVAYSKNWHDRVWSVNMFGFSSAINIGIATGEENASLYYPSLSVIWNGEPRPTYGSSMQGIVLPMSGNGLASGKFGIKTHGSGFPLLAGDTLVWEAVGEE